MTRLLVVLIGLGVGLLGSLALAAAPVVTHTSVACATTTTAVVALNTQRTFLLLENISDTAIDIKIGAAAVASEGIRLMASGGNLLMDSRSPGALNEFLMIGAVNCIHAGAATKTLLVTEGSY